MDGLHVEQGRVRDVSYAGMITRFFLDLDRGGELQVVRQNFEMSSEEALEKRGRQVRVAWDDRHEFAIPDTKQTTEEGT